MERTSCNINQRRQFRRLGFLWRLNESLRYAVCRDYSSYKQSGVGREMEKWVWKVFEDVSGDEDDCRAGVSAGPPRLHVALVFASCISVLGVGLSALCYLCAAHPR